ncbi:MAG TPA: DEAD/DEAH box helicase [Pseudonocardiaceae bacterium]|nr:DEAD/DEAH box helicase [Pseudonocardiaceae bacterium]
MPLAVPDTIDLASVEELVGATSYGRGVRYAQQGRVSGIRWTLRNAAVHGNVVGRSEVYSTSLYLVRGDDGPPYADQSECTCPIGYDCKHVAALAVAAAATQPKPSAPRTWQQSLTSLLADSPVDPVGRTGAEPLAVELTLAEGGGPTVRLSARLVRPGRTGWVAGGLSWGKLQSSYQLGEFVPEHVRLLREMYALYRSGLSSHAYGYYCDERTIDMSAFESNRLWSILDEAGAIGLAIVHARKRLGALEPYRTAEFRIDVTRDDGTIAVRPLVRVEGSDIDAAPIGFIGSTGHGVVYVDRAEVRTDADHGNWHLRLARLVKPVPAALRRMALDNQVLAIPAAEQDPFRDEFYPRLRRVATIVSSDESFVPPAILGPTLVLRLGYGDEHTLATTWEWAYRIGDVHRRAALDADEDGDDYRDPDAERAILASLDLPWQIEPRAEFRGIDTMRFTTETLPLLADRPDVLVEVSGDPADYREAGDTLAISLSTTEVAGDNDWFDLGVTISVEGRDVPFTDVFVALARGDSHLLLSDGAYFALDKPELRTLRDLIEEARSLLDSADGSLRISRFQADLWAELAALGVVRDQAEAWQRQVDGLLSIDAVAPVEVPDTLSAQLRPYQMDGFRWLAFLWDNRLGGILADDMGLGKTLQTLAMVCHARRDDPTLAPFLVVAPTSVVSNWAAEAARFAPGLAVVALSDTARRRGEPLADTVAGAHVVVTSYTLFRIEYDDYAELSWAGLVLDEAQQVKNHQSKIYQCVRRLTASTKLAITGTPMENNLMELWSLLSVTAPGLFPSPTRFREHYAVPIEKQGDTELLGRLRRRMKPLVKRRTKEQVAADLPTKQEQVLEVDLHPKHRKLYQTHLQRERQKVLGLIDDMNRNRFTILRSLTLLRQLSLHAALVDVDRRDVPSSKIDALVEQMRDVIDGGHRALVFSQFTRFLGLVRDRLDAEGVAYCYLDGSTRNRAAVLRRFKEGSDPVFLISLKAGGFGLNLTEADYCFVLDPWWNPATEAQAVDRTHRIGQTRNVMVYRLIARDTIEERVMALQARKNALFANVMDGGDMFSGGLDADDIRALFE